jgi:hypothetical protein
MLSLSQNCGLLSPTVNIVKQFCAVSVDRPTGLDWDMKRREGRKKEYDKKMAALIIGTIGSVI